MRSLFTLIELIIVIVVISILTIIVIPNISDVRDNAKKSALDVNLRTIQTAIDIYHLENDEYPTYEQPEFGIPNPIDFNKLETKYLINTPEEDDSTLYWVDTSGNLWDAKADSPTRISYRDGVLYWEESYGATSYNVYKVIEDNTASVLSDKYKLKFERNTKENNFEVGDKDSTVIYMISSIDVDGKESPPVYSAYNGYDFYAYSTQYLAFELYGSQGDKYSTITEIEVYNKDGELIPYKPIDRYDASLGGRDYWNRDVWNKNNLSNGNKHYKDNLSGSMSSTVFHGKTLSASDPEPWARFTLGFKSDEEIHEVRVWLGSPEKRNSKVLKIYKADTYDYHKNLMDRNDEGLEYFGEIVVPNGLLEVNEFIVR